MFKFLFRRSPTTEDLARSYNRGYDDGRKAGLEDQCKKLEELHEDLCIKWSGQFDHLIEEKFPMAEKVIEGVYIGWGGIRSVTYDAKNYGVYLNIRPTTNMYATWGNVGEKLSDAKNN